MDDVDLGETLHRSTYDSPGTASASDDERQDSSDDQPQTHAEPLSQRLRGSLSGLRQSLVHADGASNGGSARERLRTAMQRMRRKDSPLDNQDESDADDEHELSRRSLSQQLHSALSASGLTITDEDKLVLLGTSPLVQLQDEELFLERSSSSSVTPPTLQRGDYIRIQSSDDRTQSWLCQVAVDRLTVDADVIPLAAPFPGSLVPDAIVHFVPKECLPTGLTEDDDDDQVESEHVSELRSSVDAWRPSVDDPADSTDDDDAMERDPRFSDSSNNSTRTSVAREKAAALYENFKSKKARLRTSSSDYKEKIKHASQVSKQKLAVASQVSKEKLAVASQVSKEKLAVASQASKEKLAAASVVSKEKLAVASQASKEKLAVAGQASKLKVQSWTSSARSSIKAKMAQRAETKAAATTTTTTGLTGEVSAASGVDNNNTQVEAADANVFTIEDADDEPLTKPLVDYMGEEEQLRREVEQC